MTLMPVGNTIGLAARGCRTPGASRWMSQRSSISSSVELGDVEGLADHVEHVAEHGVADRHA